MTRDQAFTVVSPIRVEPSITIGPPTCRIGSIISTLPTQVGTVPQEFMVTMMNDRDFGNESPDLLEVRTESSLSTIFLLC